MYTYLSCDATSPLSSPHLWLLVLQRRNSALLQSCPIWPAWYMGYNCQLYEPLAQLLEEGLCHSRQVQAAAFVALASGSRRADISHATTGVQALLLLNECCLPATQKSGSMLQH